MSKIFDTQNQMIIRFPEDIAQKLNKYFDQGKQQDNVDIQIELDPKRQKQLDQRLGLNISVDGEKFKATVMQLPTITSSFKTIDRINFFKSNDVSEIIVVHDKDQDQENIRQDEAERIMDEKTGKIIKYKCQSGITGPTKYIRQNNFKIKPQVDYQKVAQVDRQMQKIRSQNAIQNKLDDKSSVGGRKKKV